MSRSLRIMSAAAVALTLTATLAVATPVAASSAADESLLLALTNGVRAAAGVPALTLDSRLSSIARDWANAMASHGNISHNGNYKAQIEAAGFDWRKSGENVGMGPTVESIHYALLDSPGHYRNIVDAEFELIGIGVVFRDNTVWVVQNFLLPAASAPAPAPARPVVTAPPVTEAAPATTAAPKPTTTTTAPPTTTTTVPPTTTTTVPLPPPSPGLPLRLALMLQQLKAISTPR